MLERAAIAAWIVVLGCGLSACRPSTPKPSTEAQGATRVAVLDGKPISQGELDAWIKEDLFRSQTEDNAPAELYELRSRALDRMLDERILAAEAARRGVSEADVLRLEREARGKISDAQVNDFYQKNQQRMGGAKLEQVSDRIRSYLDEQRDDEIKAELRKRAKIEVLLEPPRITVAAEGPARGPENAPVTIVEFSDFQCPFCGRAAPVLKQIHERYPDQVRIVYRYLPLERIHPMARGAAEAAACADAQGRFWDYHDKLFANQRALAAADLERYAQEIGLDTAAFGQCVKERRSQAVVDRDLAAATAAATAAGKRGLGTPAFFVNGIFFSGAKPAEEFFKVIDVELARAGAHPAAGS